VRAGAGVDVVKKAGMPMASLSADAFSFLAWDNNLNFGAGLSYPFGRRKGWNGAVGGILVQRLDDDIGTHLNFLFRASYCGEAVCLSYAHISHGSGLGIQTEKANSGLNFVFLEYRLR